MDSLEQVLVDSSLLVVVVLVEMPTLLLNMQEVVKDHLMVTLAIIMLVQVVVEQAILGLQQHQQKQTLDQVVVEEDMHHINQIPTGELVVLVSS
tara:strand:+ start:184 stop:465 length:282 start_codon:yes stop_codon:yes gene_type:complete